MVVILVLSCLSAKIHDFRGLLSKSLKLYIEKEKFFGLLHFLFLPYSRKNSTIVDILPTYNKFVPLASITRGDYFNRVHGYNENLAEYRNASAKFYC